MDYASFLERKRMVDPMTGMGEVPDLPGFLFPHQRDIIAWALRRGRAAIFAGTGLGSEVYGAVAAGRKGIGFELKPSYFVQAVKNIAQLHEARTTSLFGGEEA